MALVHFWFIPISKTKPNIKSFSVDDAFITIEGLGGSNQVTIFCNDEIYQSKGLVKNFGQSAIDALRDGVLENSELYTSLAASSSYFSVTDLMNPKPIIPPVGIANPAGTTLLDIYPDYQLGIVATAINATRATGTFYTALERIRDYICETNGVIP